jgi:hypothetical protein
MKLGIVVVYLFDEDLEPLLGVHLGQISKNTLVPYTIYGSVNRLDPKLRRHLETAPHVMTYELPPTELRDGEEHAYYLDQLVQIAVDAGSTHIAVLHMDSFPVRPGWAEEFDALLNDQCAIVTISSHATACLFFHRRFYIQCRPKMRLSVEEQSTPLFQQFLNAHNPTPHSGIGYEFAAIANGLRCHYLHRTAGAMDQFVIYGDSVYHFSGAVRLHDGSAQLGVVRSSLLRKLVAPLLALGRSLLPGPVWKALGAGSPTSLRDIVTQNHFLTLLQKRQRTIRALVESPDEFLDALRREP